MAQNHSAEYAESPMTRDGRIQGPSRRYRRLRNPIFPAELWTEKNPLLQRGEIGFEIDTNKAKVGDGHTYWNDLPYSFTAETEWGYIVGDIEDQTDLKNALDGKQDVIADLATIRSDAAAGKTASETIATYGDIVTHNVSEFATAAQGAKADTAVQPGDLATVATTGDYDDLLNKPTIPAAQVNSDWNANSGVAEILNKPTLGTAAAADTTDFATAAQGSLADTAVQPADLANYVTTNTTQTISGEKVFSGIMNYSAGKTYILAGNGGQKLGYWTYDIDGGSNITLQTMTASTRDINFKTNNGGKVKYNGSEVAKVSDIPTAISQLSNDSGFITNSVNDLVNYTLTSSLATVATTGDYDDLINKPTIPAAQVNSDWNAISGVAQILNKPTIPTVNDATLTIQKNGTSVATFTANASSAVTANITVPTNTSDLTNNSGFITSSDIPVTDVTVGGTSVVSSGVAAVPAIPTVNNSTITITQGGVTKGSFTLNQASGDTIALDAGSSSYTAGDCIDITSDVISVDTGNATSTTKEAIVGWGLPDYNNPISVGTFNSSNPYTAPKAGFFYCAKANGITLYVNGAESYYGGTAGSGSSAWGATVFVSKGDIITTDAGSTSRPTFYPLKGVA